VSERGEVTRERILATAEPLVLQRGFAGTSLDDILKASDLTKGAFFHHFKGKGDLARALVERFAKKEDDLFRAFAAEADALHGDPLDAAIAFLRLYEAHVEALADPLGGCIFAVYTYESQHFDPLVMAFVAESLKRWSAIYEAKFAAVLARYVPAREVTAAELADMIVALIEGGFVLSRSYGDGVLIARQSRQFRTYFDLLFGERVLREPI
jgi:TetR/AcrR family transcriptional repressor of nem operon